MSKSQKIKDIFSKPKVNLYNNISFLNKNYIQNISFIVGIFFIFFSVLGIFNSILILYISLSSFFIFLIPLILYLTEKISILGFKISTFTIIVIFYYIIYAIQTEFNLSLFYLINIIIISFVLFDDKKTILSSFLSIIIFDIIYFVKIFYTQYSINEIIILNLTFYSVILTIFFFKKIENKKKEISDKQILRERILIELDKKIIAFTLHQLRSSITNYVVFSDIKKYSETANTEQKELEKIKEQSSKILCSSFAILEIISGKKEEISKECSLDKTIEKIISFYKINNKNIKIVNFNQENNFLNTKHQIIILKAIIIAFETIDQIIDGQKTNIIFEYIDDKDYFSYNFTIKKKNDSRILTNRNIPILLEILKNNLEKNNSKFSFSIKENENSILQLKFNKENYIKEDNLIEVKKKEIINNTKYKLLLGEDDEINQKIYSIGFEKYFGKIDIADNGSKVLKKLEKSGYDILVLDLQMPTMNGIETIEKIRKLEQITGNHLLVIAITANTLIYNRQEILNFGFDEYFIKPFNIKKIYQSFLNLKKLRDE